MSELLLAIFLSDHGDESTVSVLEGTSELTMRNQEYNGSLLLRRDSYL